MSALKDLRERVRHLEGRVEELEALVEYLACDDIGSSWRVHMLAFKFGIKPSEAKLLFVLYRAAGRVMSHEALMAALYHARPNDAPDPEIIKVYVCKIRAALKPYGIRIETAWSTGYCLSHEAARAIEREISQALQPTDDFTGKQEAA